MKEIVFLLEERSAKAMLESLLPRLLNTDTNYRFITFEGKQDLKKQLERKIRGYQNNHARFIILRDQDSHPSCMDIKQCLIELCSKSGKGSKCKIRIACRELEAFYLADLQAVGTALNINGLTRHQSNRKFRSPDQLENPSFGLKKLTNNVYEKVSGSRAIGQHLNIENVRSPSFRNFMNAIKHMEADLQSDTSHA